MVQAQVAGIDLMTATLHAAPSCTDFSMYIEYCVLQGTPGLTFGKAEDKMGWNAQPTCAIMMDDVRVPAANLLGDEGKGFNIAMNACNPAYDFFINPKCTIQCRQSGLHQSVLMQT